MSSNIENMMNQLIFTEDIILPLENLINGEPIYMEKAIDFIFDNVEQIQNNEKLDKLSKFLANELFKNRSLSMILDRIDIPSDNETNSIKKKIIKNILAEIGKTYNVLSFILFMLHLAVLIKNNPSPDHSNIKEDYLKVYKHAKQTVSTPNESYITNTYIRYIQAIVLTNETRKSHLCPSYTSNNLGK